MEGNYGVWFGNSQAGKVQVRRQGLYYRFFCRCRLSGDVICRLTAHCAGQVHNLGVVVPTGDGFGLDRKIPVKHFPEGEVSFVLVPGRDLSGGTFVAIAPEEPFAYISRLKDAFFVRQGTKTGAIIRTEQGNG